MTNDYGHGPEHEPSPEHRSEHEHDESCYVDHDELTERRLDQGSW